MISFNSCSISANIIELLEASDAFLVLFFAGEGEDSTNSGIADAPEISVGPSTSQASWVSGILGISGVLATSTAPLSSGARPSSGALGT